MAAKTVVLVDGKLRARSPYRASLVVVASGATGDQVNVGDADNGDIITLPSSGSYTGNELLVLLNGSILEAGVDYTFTSSTTITNTGDNWATGDTIQFFKVHNP